MNASVIAPSAVRTFARVSFEGLEAYTDAYAIEEDSFKFLSLFGSRVSVRAIWSALLSGTEVLLDGAPSRMEKEDSWQVFQRILPSGALHAVCFSRLTDLTRVQNEFVVLGRTKDEVTNRFYLYLDKVSETPVSPEWSERILNEALGVRKALRLKALYLSAVSYRHEEAWLQDFITGFLTKRKKLEVYTSKT